MSQDHKRVVALIEFEPPKTKGSRFIATCSPLIEPVELDRLIANLRKRFPAANHHTWAYRIGDGRETFRYSDDGEPSGLSLIHI